MFCHDRHQAIGTLFRDRDCWNRGRVMVVLRMLVNSLLLTAPMLTIEPTSFSQAQAILPRQHETGYDGKVRHSFVLYTLSPL
jgi:hypothetical protein